MSLGVLRVEKRTGVRRRVFGLVNHCRAEVTVSVHVPDKKVRRGMGGTKKPYRRGRAWGYALEIGSLNAPDAGASDNGWFLAFGCNLPGLIGG